MYRTIIQVGRDFWRSSGVTQSNSKQHPLSGQIFCLYREHAGSTLAFLCPVQHATRHTKTSGMRRSVSIHTPHTHKDVLTTQGSVHTAFAATSETAFKSSPPFFYVPYSK